MDERRKKDIIRYTLQSYLGKSLRDLVLNETHKAAISRLNSMREERFEQLCLDLINEIHRRNGMSFETPNELGAKLLKISDQKFKNLIVETLTVFYMRNTCYKQEEMPEFLENMTNLIAELKNCAESETFLCQVEKLNFYDKIYEFYDFIKNKSVSEPVILKMKTFTDEHLDKRAYDFIDSLCYPDIFLKALMKSEIFEKEIKSDSIKFEQFQKNYDEIIKSQNIDGLELNVKSTIAKKNLVEIISTIVNSISIPSKKIVCFESELSTLIQILELIETEIRFKKQFDLQDASLKLSDILNSIVSKGELLSQENLNELKIQQVSVELMSNSISREESFKLVLDIAKDIRKALAFI